MNYFVGAAVLVAGLFSASLASAADYKDPPASFSWTGCYVGAQAGVGNFQGGTEGTGSGVAGLAGGQVGCDRQFEQLVLGLEAEGLWSGLRGGSQAVNTNSCSTVCDVSVRNTWMADIAPRVGFAINRVLVYGKAGALLADMTVDQSSLGFESTHSAGVFDGLLLGVGIEYAFFQHWSVKFEYDYVTPIPKNFAVSCTGFCPVGVGEISGGLGGPLVKLGVNYRL